MQAVVFGQEDWLQLLLPPSQPRPCLCVGGGFNTNPHYFKYDFFFKATKAEILSKMTWEMSMPICEEEEKEMGERKEKVTEHDEFGWLGMSWVFS